MRYSQRCASIVVAILVSYTEAIAAPYHGLVVFGDSLSDNGNYFISSHGTPPPPYVEGRFTNGPNYAEDLAAFLGLSMRPSLVGGTDFAYNGGRTSGNPPFDVLSQVSSYTSSSHAADPNALYVVFAGTNNVKDALESAAANPANAATIAATAIQQGVSDLHTVLDRLAAFGAKQVVVPNVQNIGLSPLVAQLGPTAVALATGVTASFDQALDAMLDQENGLHIIRFDSFSFLNTVAAHPAQFGLTNVTDACYSGDDLNFTGRGRVCSSPASYFFWDEYHPTATVHTLFGEALYAAIIPEPATWLLFGSGVAVLVALRRRCQHDLSSWRGDPVVLNTGLTKMRNPTVQTFST